MVTIADDLLSFKNKIDNNIDSIKSCTNTISDKLNKLSDTVNNASSSISASYNSENKSTILNKLSNVNDIYKIIENSIHEYLDVIISDCSGLLGKIKELENKKSLVDAAYNDMTQDPSKSSNYNNLVNEFNLLHSEAVATLNRIKTNDTEISFENEFQTNDLSVINKNLQFGSYEKYTFTSSSNYKIKYYLYKPDYGESVKGLPTLVYIPGAGERGDRTNTSGLPQLIDQRKITPSGMIIVPQFSGEQELNTTEYQKSLIELTNYIVEQNNGDKNKISLCGHSVGATIGYKIIADNPDYFAAFVPLSGKAVRVTDKNGNINSNAYNALKNMNILSICGTGDTPYGNFSTSKKIAEDLKQVNPNVHFIPLEGFGHIIQTKVFGESYQLENGQNVSILDWVFSQTKNV